VPVSPDWRAGGIDRHLEAAIAYAQRKGCVVVAAMGNDGNNSEDYPASYPGVIAVGATDQDDQLANFSNYGRWVSVVAPGADIYSTMPTYHVTLDDVDPGADRSYGLLSGTSMATPYVAGLAALMVTVNPRLTPGSVKTALQNSADKVGGALGFNIQTGYGRIDAPQALRAVM